MRNWIEFFWSNEIISVLHSDILMCLHLPIKNESWELMQIQQAYLGYLIWLCESIGFLFLLHLLSAPTDKSHFIRGRTKCVPKGWTVKRQRAMDKCIDHKKKIKTKQETSFFALKCEQLTYLWWTEILTYKKLSLIFYYLIGLRREKWIPSLKFTDSN